MSERRVERWLAPVIALVALVTYSTTICRTIYWGDGIELTSIAAVLGVAHPTGYPLFALLGKTFAQLPLGTIAFRLNLMSAVAGALLAALVGWTVWRLLPLLGVIENDRVLARASLAAAAAWTVAFSRTFWYHAGLTEVYLLSTAVLVATFALCIQAVANRQPRWFLAACFLCGLGLCNHTIAVLLIPSLAAVAVWLALEPRSRPQKRKRRTRAPGEPLVKRLVRLGVPALLVSALALSAYSYLPLRAAKNPPLNWGDPSTPERLLWSVRGGEFRKFYWLKVPLWLFPQRPYPMGTPFDGSTYPPFFRYRVSEWLGWTADQIVALPHDQTALRAMVGLLLLLAAIAGWRVVALRRPILAIFLAAIVLSNILVITTYSIRDIEGYFFPSHVVAVICLFVALARLHRWTEERLLACRSDVLAGLFLALPIAVGLQGRAVCDHSHYDAAERYGREVLAQLEPDAMILTQGDYDIEPLWYQQIVEHRRRDVVVFGSNFLATPGYAKYFEGRYDPPVAAQFFDQTPDEASYFKALAETIIAANLQRRPLYATWFDPRMGVEADRIEVSVLREPEVRAVAEREYFPAPFFHRLRRPEVRP